MAEAKDIRYSITGGGADHHEKESIQERRRSSIADLNRNKNLDAKYVAPVPFASQLISIRISNPLADIPQEELLADVSGFTCS